MTAHVVADVVFAEESTLICTCGEDVHAADEDELVEAFQAHRVAEGERRRLFVSSEYKPSSAFKWRDTPAAASTAAAESKRAYYHQNRERVLAQQREYRARRREVAA